MWQRFTERARRVIFFAQEEADRFNEAYVSTEHILLGLIRENDTVAARVLDQLGVRLENIRSETEKNTFPSAQKPVQEGQLTPRAKRVIDLGYQEAQLLLNNYIGTEHLLLGLIREEDGMAGQILRKLGVELEKARQEVRLSQESAPIAESNAPTLPTPSRPTSVLQAVTAINTYAYGVDSQNWPLAVRYFTERVEVDFSAVNGIKGRLLRADIQHELQQRLGKPDLQVHTLLGQLLTHPDDPSQFIVYYTVRYFKGQVGIAAKFEVHGWFTYRMDGDAITTLTAHVSAMEGNPALFS